MRCVRLLVAVLTVGLFASPAAADPTDLINVPVARILRPGHFRLQGLQDVACLDRDRPRRTSFLTEFGLFERVEGGVDFNTFGTGPLVEGDLKYQLLDPGGRRWGAAVGISNLGPGFTASIYAVGTGDFGRASLTAGVADWQGHASALVGVQYPRGARLSGYAEWISGPTGSVAVGLSYRASEQVSLMVWWQDFNNRPVERIQFDLIVTGAFR